MHSWSVSPEERGGGAPLNVEAGLSLAPPPGLGFWGDPAPWNPKANLMPGVHGQTL